MSLASRVERAGNAPGEMVAPGHEALIELLRGRVRQIVSIDHLAYVARENPRQAQNEVRSACRTVLEEEMWATWDEEEKSQLIEDLVAAIFGFGVIEDLIEDESVTEIMVNGPSRVFLEREGKIQTTNRRFASEADLRALIDRILGPLGRRIDESSPMVNARLPQGHRVNVVVPPIALDGPVLTIRKFASHVITLEEMQELGSIDPQLGTFLAWAVRMRKSIAVSGGTGSGKTTLLNALSCKIPLEERIVTIEDSAELRFLEHPHVVRLEARPKNSEGTGEITIRDLVMNALRMRPDRIVVGECRGAEALDMLQAMNTGHSGSLTTLHANSPEDSIARLTTMVRYAADLPVDVIEANIASAIDLVVQTHRCADGSRKVVEVVSLKYSRDLGRCEVVDIYARNPKEETGTWSFLTNWVDQLEDQGLATAEEVSEWKCACSCAA